MRWLLTIAALGTVAVLPLAQAQMRGGGGRASSGSSGFSSGRSGFGSAPAPRHFAPPASSFNGGFRSGGGVRTSRPFVPVRPGFRTAPVGFHTARRFDFDRDRRFFDHDGRFRHFHHFRRPFIFSGGCIHGPFFSGFPCRHFFFNNAFVWGYAPFYADYSYPDYSYPDYSYAPAQQQPAAADNNNVELAYEVGRLSGEVEQLREEKASEGTAYQEQQPAPAVAPARPAKPEPDTLVTLVFRDGHRITVKNYAIVGSTLWILNDRSSRKVPLSDLDVEATQRVNEENGVELHLRVASAAH
jgi:hypothetical protein